VILRYFKYMIFLNLDFLTFLKNPKSNESI